MQPLPAQAAMKRPRDLFFEEQRSVRKLMKSAFENAKHRRCAPRRPALSLETRPPRTLVHVLSFIYPEDCLDFESADQMTRMTERMFEGFTHNHEVMVLGRRALDVLMSSRSLGDELALYRGRLQRFQEALHIRFVDECICWLVDDSRGPVPNHELRALRITAARRSPSRGREFAMEQALLRPAARNFGRRYCDCRLQREALLDEMTSEPLPLSREDLGDGEVVV